MFINIITGSVGDKETMTPEYKVVAVDFEKILDKTDFIESIEKIHLILKN